MLDPTQLSEAETRYNVIDPLLKKAGWNLADRTQISFEVPVDGYEASPINGVTDYCLFRANGEVLAVIEAKRTRRDARVGKEQVLQYVTKIAATQSFCPFAFMTNGDRGGLSVPIFLLRESFTKCEVTEHQKGFPLQSLTQLSANFCSIELGSPIIFDHIG